MLHHKQDTVEALASLNRKNGFGLAAVAQSEQQQASLAILYVYHALQLAAEISELLLRSKFDTYCFLLSEMAYFLMQFHEFLMTL